MSTFSKTMGCSAVAAAAAAARPAFYSPIHNSGVCKLKVFESAAATGGPWDPLLQHGGPPSALMAAVAEDFLATTTQCDNALEVRRVTVLFYRPIPVAPVFLDVRPLRLGRKASHVEVSLFLDEEMRREAALVTVLAMPRRAVAGVPPPPTDAQPRPSVPPPLAGFDTAAGSPRGEVCCPRQFGSIPFFHELTLRPPGARPQKAGEGPCAMWFHTQTPLVAGAGPMSPASRLLLTADSAGGMSSYVDRRKFTFVNSDTTVNIVRTPVAVAPDAPSDTTDGWLLMSARTQLTPAEGCGLAQADIMDVDGLCATVTQTQVLEETVRRKTAQ